MCILTANYLVFAGYKVLVIDLDVQNSLSFYYLDEPGEADNQNSAKALSDSRLTDNIISISDSLGIVPASLNLIKLRAISGKVLAGMIGEAEGLLETGLSL